MKCEAGESFEFGDIKLLRIRSKLNKMKLQQSKCVIICLHGLRYLDIATSCTWKSALSKFSNPKNSQTT